MAILKLLNKYFIRGWVGPLSMFSLPLFFALLYIAIDSSVYIDNFPTILAFAILSPTLMVIPQLLVELRKSLILKRIGSAKISVLKFVSIVLFYFMIIISISTASTFLIYFLIGLFAIDAKDLFANLSWWSALNLIFSCLMLGMLSILISIIIALFIKSSVVASVVSFMLLFMTLFSSGVLMPLYQVRQIEAMKWMSYFIPTDWPLLMIKSSWGVMDMNEEPKVVVDNIWNLASSWKMWAWPIEKGPRFLLTAINPVEKSLHLIGSFVFIPASLALVRFTFKWGER